MSDSVEIKPGMKIKIKQLGILGKAIVEAIIAEGEIKAIRPFPDNLDEADEIVLTDGRTFFLTSETRIEVV